MLLVQRKCVAVDKCTRKVVGTYKSLSEAGKCNGATRQTVWNQCERKTVGFGDRYFRYEDEFDPNEVFSCAKGLPVLVTTNTNTCVFDSVESVSKALMYSTRTINKWIRQAGEHNGITVAQLRERFVNA